MNATPRIARVAVAAPVYRLFDYLSRYDQPPPLPGMRVCVPFGRRRATGVVVAVGTDSEVSDKQLKTIERILDPQPLIPERLLELLSWAAGYYHHPIGEVIAAALPGRLRRREVSPAVVRFWRVSAAGAGVDEKELDRAPMQREILRAIRAAPQGLERDSLVALSRRWRAAVDALVAKGWVETVERDPLSVADEGGISISRPPTPAQDVAVDAIAAAQGFQPFLLYGVTGSGKTEVYLRVLERVLEQGDQALMLVPEIGLTPQALARVRERIRMPVSVLHSGLGDAERMRAWVSAASGKTRLVIGTRSAVFTPMPRLRVIVVDEEHDASYKQQEGFRYSARDVAVMRASRESIPIVLGSATPSLETLNHAQSGGYRLLNLPARPGGARLPEFELLDMRRLAVEDGLSHPLCAALGQTLQRREQSLLFLNRRGFAPLWMCFGCGWIAPCARCDARMTFHRASALLRCHHCGAEQSPMDVCPNCRNPGLRPMGEGTERVESALAKRFPDARLVRIDRDSTRAKGALEEKLGRVHAGDADILIGTQMLSKGHDFPDVTLVGVLNADQGLYGSDFRADERLVQQITQVSGRAGRADKPGRVLVQTYHPDHPVFAALRDQSYDEFAAYALAERRATGYPPFRHLVLLRAESPKADAPLAFLRMAAVLATLCKSDSSVDVLEPVPSPMERRAGRYRAQLLVSAPRRAPLHAFINCWLERLGELKESRRVRWSLDVDPSDLY